MDKMLSGVSVSRDSDPKKTKINGFTFSLNNDFDKDAFLENYSTLKLPEMTSVGREISEQSLVPHVGNIKHKRCMFMFLMSLLENKSGKKVYGLKTSDNTVLLTMNPTKVEDVVLPTKVEEDVKVEAKKPEVEEDVKVVAKKPEVEEDVKVVAKKPEVEEDVKVVAKKPEVEEDVKVEAKKPIAKKPIAKKPITKK